MKKPLPSVYLTPDIYARPVIPLLISLMCGITFGIYLPGYKVWLFPLTGLALAAILIHVISKRPSGISPLLLFLCLGYLSIQPFIAPEYPSNHVIHYVDKGKWQITGNVDQEPYIQNNRMRCMLNIHQLGSHMADIQVVGKIRVTISGRELPELGNGDIITFASRIRSIRNFHNPGGFDYERYMRFKKIFGSAYIQADKLVILKRHQETGVLGVISRYRDNISSLIHTTLSGDPQKILTALITGEQSQIDPSLRDRFNRAGLGHLLAISGLHVGIVASAAFMAFAWLFSRFEFFLWHAWTKKGAALVTIFPVIFYGLLAGMSPSTQRAVLMVSVFLMTFLIQREQDILNTLAIAALVILIVSPVSLFSISFQLSFTAVFFIIYGLPGKRPAIPASGSKWSGIQTRIFQFLLVSFLAIIGTLPLVMHYFNQVSLVGFFSNLIGIPMIGFLVVPIGIASAFIFPLSPFLSSLGIKMCGTFLEVTLTVINAIAGVPFAAIKTITPNLFEMACIYILLWSILTLLKKKDVPLFSGNRGVWGLILLCSITLLGDTGYYMYQRFWRSDLRITMIDVGQGNAALLELPKGKTMLIDGGGFSDNTIFDVGERIVAPFLWRKKITAIDTLILSHPNSDHLNGLTFIADHFHVKQVLSNSETANTKSFDAFMQVIRKHHIALPRFESLPRHQVIAGVTFDIVHPQKNFFDHKYADNNNNSLVVKVTFGETAFLFPGDIMAEGEHMLVRHADISLKSTVLLAPHHGSRTSSTRRFLNQIDPDVVVVSCGWNNRFHMPHQTVLDRYREMDIMVYRTDLNGAVTLISDGQALKVDQTIDPVVKAAESAQGH